LFALVRFVGKNVSEIVAKYCLTYLTWPPWAKQHNGTDSFFKFSFIIEGTSKKVLQFLMPLEPIYNKNFYFNELNVYYEQCRKV
jgi:hypothetical protein